MVYSAIGRKPIACQLQSRASYNIMELQVAVSSDAPGMTLLLGIAAQLQGLSLWGLESW